jgi:hypothetical protein
VQPTAAGFKAECELRKVYPQLSTSNAQQHFKENNFLP